MTEAQIKLGIPKIIDNAEALYSDACYLEENGRIERAYSLFQLSIEEIGKALMLVGAILFEDIEKAEVQERIINVFKNHEKKTNISIGLDSFLWDSIKSTDPGKYENMVLGSIREHESVRSKNEKKNYSLYVSFNGNKFISPSETITNEEVKSIKAKAGYRNFMGKKLFTAIVNNLNSLKKGISDLDYDINQVSDELRKEFQRILEKVK